MMFHVIKKMRIHSTSKWGVSFKQGEQRWPYWKVAFQQRDEGSEEAGHVGNWGRRAQRRETSCANALRQLPIWHG